MTESEALAEAFAFGCDSCGAQLEVHASQRTTVCPYCASPSVVARPPSRDRPPPAFCVGFVLPEEDAIGLVRRWVKRQSIFTRSSFKKAPVDRTRGVYVPAYLYGAVARTQYSADIGENYTVTETYTTTVNGKTVTRTRTKTKTEWRPLSGHHACYVRDIIVTASRGIHNNELEAIEPFDLRAIKRYKPALISGWFAEEPSMTADDCFELARKETGQEILGAVANFMPGDKHRNLRTQFRLHREVMEQILLPVWVFAVRYDEKKPPARVMVNGQTGQVSGYAPRSTLKVLLMVLFFIGLIAGGALWYRLQL